ncbi:hypothetical protein Taro_004192 [Colocasia esculenta]|uniref:Uncharacterized protein n=1 Tax=Colocasia esculenta TaxID=4460 RepID=A0A843THI7_COLES|nr:hypothetical protein [Colocasia esculenta]
MLKTTQISDTYSAASAAEFYAVSDSGSEKLLSSLQGYFGSFVLWIDNERQKEKWKGCCARSIVVRGEPLFIFFLLPSLPSVESGFPSSSLPPFPLPVPHQKAMLDVMGSTKLWKRTKKRKVRKVHGCSSIDRWLGSGIHTGDASHPTKKEIYEMLDEMEKGLKIAGFEPDTKQVLIDIDEKRVTENSLIHHSKEVENGNSLWSD